MTSVGSTGIDDARFRSAMLQCRTIIIQRPCPAAFFESACVRAAPLVPLKLHALPASLSNAFTAYGDGYVEVNAIRFDHSIVVVPDRPVMPWPVASFEGLSVENFAQVAGMNPELVVFGSGARLRFAQPRLTAPLTARGIGVETMDLHAACRTYNILMAEGRKVAAVLLIETLGVPR